jgi:hypothetical protein
MKHAAFEDEREHRITITEHLGSRSASQMSALSTLDQPFSDFAQGPLQTLDVRFRPGGPTMFKRYVSLPFDHAALVKSGDGTRNQTPARRTDSEAKAGPKWLSAHDY